MPKGVRRKPRPTPLERFWNLVDRPDDPIMCWQWRGVPNHDGYGRFNDGTRMVMAHRFAYEALVGPIPPELESDHLCKNRGCVNPAHIRPTTHLENMKTRDLSRVNAHERAKTHCPKGHEYNTANTYLRPDGGGRDCLKCRYVRSLRMGEKRKAVRVARLSGRVCDCGAPAQMARTDGSFTCRRCHLLTRIRPARYA